ncbi:hypothetical protein ALC62_09769, partial [Cyphomyrmex costatus]
LNKRSRLAHPYAFRLCNSNPPFDSAYSVKLASMNTSSGQVCAALSFTTFPRGFTISGLDEGLIPDPNTVLADFSVYLKSTLHRCCFRLHPVSLDKSIAMEGENPHSNICYLLIKCSNLFRH